jgi:hypothetical protein|tara:strand:- start:58 stop:420 length:363 start_codon:yes stop_codon:yes gene_type:complete
MTVKLAILKSGEDIVADIKEMVVGEGDDARVVGYVLTKPCGVSLNSKSIKIDDEKDTYQLKLFPWCPLTKNEKIPITADWVVTIVDPIDKITQMYTKEVLENGTSKGASADKQTDSSEST